MYISWIVSKISIFAKKILLRYVKFINKGRYFKGNKYLEEFEK